jgi:hypothetical protein
MKGWLLTGLVAGTVLGYTLPALYYLPIERALRGWLR